MLRDLIRLRRPVRPVVPDWSQTVMTALHNEIAAFLEEERQRAARELIDRTVKDL